MFVRVPLVKVASDVGRRRTRRAVAVGSGMDGGWVPGDLKCQRGIRGGRVGGASCNGRGSLRATVERALAFLYAFSVYTHR